MINRPLVRRKAMIRLIGRLMPGMFLAFLAEIILLAVTFLQSAGFDAVGVVLPSTNDLMTPQALEAYVLNLLADKYILFKMAAVVLGSSLVSFVIGAPLRFGSLRWYWQAAQDKTEPVGYAINSYGSLKEIGRSLWIYIYTGLHYVKWGILTFAAPVALLGGAVLLQDRGKQGAALTLAYLAVILFVIMFILFIYIINRFFLAPYLYAGGEISAVEAVRQSKERMRGQAGGLFVFRFMLVFIELLAALFCYGAATIVATPYVSMCEASYAAELVFTLDKKPEEVEYTVE